MAHTIDLRKKQKETSKKVMSPIPTPRLMTRSDYSTWPEGEIKVVPKVRKSFEVDATEISSDMTTMRIPGVPVPQSKAQSPKISWGAPSFYYNPQKKYLALVVFALVAGAAALLFYDRDMLLAIFLMLASLVLILYANKKPEISEIKVDQTGVSISDKVYYYRELKSFWIDYNPDGPKELSLESRKWYLPHIKVSIEKEDPVELRSLMINFVPEKIHEQSLIDFVAKKLGI